MMHSHRPKVVGFHVDENITLVESNNANHHKSNNSSSSNMNVKKSHHGEYSASATKTPGNKNKNISSSSRRVVFGDISNRKSKQQQQLDDDNKKRGSVNGIGENKKTPMFERKLNGVNTTNKASITVSTAGKAIQINQRSNNKVATPVIETTITTKNPKDLKESNRQSHATIKTNVEPELKSLSFSFDQYDEIKSAGRTWRQQRQNGDHDSDDDDSPSLEGIMTVREDYIDALKVDYDRHLRIKQARAKEEAEYVENILNEFLSTGFVNEEHSSQMELSFDHIEPFQDLDLDLSFDLDL